MFLEAKMRFNYVDILVNKMQVGGRLVEYEGLTFVTVRGAGHLVPLDKPSEALSLFHSFLTGEPLRTQR